MKSMTGFGRSSHRTVETPKLSARAKSKAAAEPEIDISIRSVNGRYLELRFHIPREYAGLESEFKSILSETFTRGTLDIYVNRKASGTQKLKVDSELAKQWLDGYRQLAKDLKLDADISLETIARAPEVIVVSQSQDSEVSEAEKKIARKVLRAAAEACDNERVREGKSLKAELTRLTSRLEKIAFTMENLKAEAGQELERRYRERLGEGLKKFGAGQGVDDQRIAQEIVMQLDRGDIAEELTRLREHLKAYQQLLVATEPQGKKLDFYAQELLREVNTIGSKSHIARLTSLVVEAKTIVEKIREQVQNAE